MNFFTVRYLGIAITVILIIIFCLYSYGNSQNYQGPVSDNFDGEKFYNPGYEKSSSVLGYLWLRLTEGQATWPESVPGKTVLPEPLINDETAKVTFVGHATALIQVDGLNILTDPVWSMRASPFTFAGPKRIQMPGVDFNDLPKIDLVLISHNHYDHLDTKTLKDLNDRDKPLVLVPLGNKKLVESVMKDSTVQEHDWGDVVDLPESNLRVFFEPMFHGSGRTPFDQQQSLWAAFVIQTEKLKLYFIGDSGYRDGSIFKETAKKHGGFDLAFIPIGAYEPTEFMSDSHMSPAEAVQLYRDINTKRAFAHHFEAFHLGFEEYESPREYLVDELMKNDITTEQFLIPLPGDAVTISPTL